MDEPDRDRAHGTLRSSRPVHLRPRDGTRLRLLRARPDGRPAELRGARGLPLAIAPERGVLRRLLRALRAPPAARPDGDDGLRLPRHPVVAQAHLLADPDDVHALAGDAAGLAARPDAPRLAPYTCP